MAAFLEALNLEGLQHNIEKNTYWKNIETKVIPLC